LGALASRRSGQRQVLGGEKVGPFKENFKEIPNAKIVRTRRKKKLKIKKQKQRGGLKKRGGTGFRMSTRQMSQKARANRMETKEGGCCSDIGKKLQR